MRNSPDVSNINHSEGVNVTAFLVSLVAAVWGIIKAAAWVLPLLPYVGG